MSKKHLVTDNPQNMTESMLNFAYAKNEKVYLRYANETEDIDLCEYVSQLTKKNGCNLSADDVMEGSCIEGCDCETAVLYTLAVQAAELRERLKHYESLEEQGLLQTLPCKVGDVLYITGFVTLQIIEVKVIGVYLYDEGVSLTLDNGMVVCVNQQLGETVFLTKEQAEKALKARANNE